MRQLLAEYWANLRQTSTLKIAIGSVLVAVGMYLQDQMQAGQMVQIALTALLTLGLRNAQAKQSLT